MSPVPASDPLLVLREYRQLAPWGLRDLATVAGALLDASGIRPIKDDDGGGPGGAGGFGGRRLRARRRLLIAHEDLVALALDAPARERIEGGRPHRLARAQAEAGMVPGAADGVADHEALGERAVIVGAERADGEQLLAAPRQQ